MTDIEELKDIEEVMAEKCGKETREELKIRLKLWIDNAHKYLMNRQTDKFHYAFGHVVALSWILKREENELRKTVK